MDVRSTLWRFLLIFFAAVLGILFALMVLAFPFGAYVVFNTDLGATITYEFPLNSFYIFLAGLPVDLPVNNQLGELFIVLWCVYLLFFTLLMLGPRKNILQSLVRTVEGEEHASSDNALQMVIIWLAVLLVISKGLEILQQSVGVSIGSYEFSNPLIQFFNITAAPIREELGFRVVLIGIPAYIMLARRYSISDFFKALWYPSKHTRSDQFSRRNVYVLITVSAVLFGLAHLFYGGGWSYGKISQAMIGGWIIGWLYYRYGLHAAILMHWSTNYFVFAYGYLGNTVWGFPENSTTNNPLLGGIDLLLTIVGIIAIGFFFKKRIREYIAVKEQNSFKDSNIM
ncbi:MAG: CPBP family intramembrane glutamic endopeptidase [Nitrososphaerales archaeon]